MRLETEYFLRTGFFKDNLEFPCSLFLVNLWSQFSYKAITIELRKKDDTAIVKQWDIDKATKDCYLPSVKCSTINIEEIYTSEHTVIKDYKPIDYNYLDYQYVHSPLDADANWHINEQNSYHRYEKSRYFSDSHVLHREKALWHCFLNSYLPISCGEFRRGCSFESQQQVIKESSHTGWNKWVLWKKAILDFPGNVAPELAFQESYVKKIDMNEEYQEMLRDQSTAVRYSFASASDVDFAT